MDEAPIAKFISLIELDQKINRANNRIAIIKQDIVQRELEGAETQNALDRVALHRSDMKKKIDLLELSLKELDQKEKERRLMLDGVQTPKEYKSIQDEITHLQQQQQAIEPILMRDWRAYETADEAYQEKKLFCDEQIGKADEVIYQKSQEMVEIQKEIQQYMAGREAIQEGVPVEWLEKYGVMRTQVTNPMVAIQGENCGACFVNLLKQDLIDLRKRKLIQCKQCYRFIYIGQIEPTET